MLRFFSKQKGINFKDEIINFFHHTNAKIRKNAIDELDESFEEHIKNLNYLIPLLNDIDLNIRAIVKDILLRNVEIYQLKESDYFSD